MRLYHFSEEPDIAHFEPRPPRAHPEVEPLVWAVDEAHEATYLFPRDCPRAFFWPREDSSKYDRARYWSGVTAGRVVAVEAAWLDRLRTTTLFRYTLPSETFALRDAIAGHWVSSEPVSPLAVEPVDDLLGRIVATGVELRVMPSLVTLCQGIAASTFNFSMTRLRNAQGWVE